MQICKGADAFVGRADADLKRIDAGCHVQTVDERALAAVDLHALVVAAAVSEARDREIRGGFPIHLHQVVAEVVHIHRAHTLALLETAAVHKGVRVAHGPSVALAGDKAHQIERMAAEVAQRAGARERLLVPPGARQIVRRAAARLQILHVNVVDFPEHALLHKLPCIARRSLEAVGEAYHAGKPALRGHPRENIRLLRR